MPDSEFKFLRLALSPQVTRSALKVSLVVGTILALINHGGVIFDMTLGSERSVQILLTYLVPYCVSTYSSVRAIQTHARVRE